MPTGASVATLSQLCATKFRVPQPSAFGLFLYKEQGYQRLPPRTLAHTLPATGYLVYRRAEHSDTPQAGSTAEGICGDPETGGKGEEEGDQGEVVPKISISPRDSREQAEEGEG